MKKAKLATSFINMTLGASGAITLACPAWAGFRLPGLLPILYCDGEALGLSEVSVRDFQAGSQFSVCYAFVRGQQLDLTFCLEEDGCLSVHSRYTNASVRSVILNALVLLQCGIASFGESPGQVRILEQGNYWGRVRLLGELAGQGRSSFASEPNSDRLEAGSASDFVSETQDSTNS